MLFSKKQEFKSRNSDDAFNLSCLKNRFMTKLYGHHSLFPITIYCVPCLNMDNSASTEEISHNSGSLLHYSIFYFTKEKKIHLFLLKICKVKYTIMQQTT